MRVVWAVFFSWVFHSVTFAWGKEGHEIVAFIAYQQLAPKTRIAIDHILSDSGPTAGPERFMEAAVWPDEIKRHPGQPVTVFSRFGVRNAAGTHAFHFADMAGDHYDPRTDTERGKSVVSGIDHCKAALRSAGTPGEARREALSFLIHFVGDIHQPLHAGRKGDKGGNSIHIDAFLHRQPAKGFNLHEVWDDLLIQSRDRDPVRYGQTLLARMPKRRVEEYTRQMDPAAWADESHRLAMTTAYVGPDGAAIPEGARLGTAYASRNVPVVEDQLLKAGIRLAAVLDQLVR
jgi:S1/P1 Nuclease